MKVRAPKRGTRYQREPGTPPILRRLWFFRIGAVVLALLVLIAFKMDLNNLPGFGRQLPTVADERQDLVLSLTQPPVTNNAASFRIVPPVGWQMRRPPDSDPYDLVFWSPNRASLSLMATPVPYNELSALYKEIQESEARMDIRNPVETVRLGGRMVIQRKATLLQERVLTLDFVEDKVAYHAMFSAPIDTFAEYEPQVLDLLQTFTPIVETSGQPEAALEAP